MFKALTFGLCRCVNLAGRQVVAVDGLQVLFVLRLVIDLGMLPQPSQFVAIQPGETWKFQAWHRDVNAAGPTSNFTSGVEIDFN